MFDPFLLQSQLLRKMMNQQGLDLVLQALKKMVDAYDGQIKVESKIGIGTTFTIKLKSSIETALDK